MPKVIVQQKLRVAVLTNIPSEPRYYPVPDLRTALIVIEIVAAELLEIDEIETSVILLELWFEELGDEGAGWGTWYDELGRDLDAYTLDDEQNVVLIDD